VSFAEARTPDGFYVGKDPRRLSGAPTGSGLRTRLPAEVRTIVIAAWTRGDMVPKAVIEQMVPERIRQESLPPLSSPA